MSDDDWGDLDVEEESADAVEMLASAVDDAIASLRNGSNWATSQALMLGAVSWTPSLISTDAETLAVLHIHVADRIRPFLVKRMRAALAAGYRVHVALHFDSLFDADILSILGELDAFVHVFRDPKSVPEKPTHLLSALADEGVAVDNSLRSQLARQAWDRRSEGQKFERGRRFEGLVSFLLSQVPDFRVRDRNLRGDTDEIDVVVQIDAPSGRCWYESGVPFILVEAKNWVDNVPQKEVSAFITKVQTRHGRCKIGFMIASKGFTSDARDQALKLAMTNIVIVFAEKDDLEAWIDHDDPAEFVENLFSRAMLR